MKVFVKVAVSAMMMLVATGADAASDRYLRHPVFQNIPPMEVRMETQFGYGDTGSFPFGVLGAFGIGISDALTAGVYGQFFTSDRDLPYKVSFVRGGGGFAEYAIDMGGALTPFAGLRLGVLDPSGPGSSMVTYAGGYAGVKYPLTKTVSVSAALTLHLASDRDSYKAYNYERSGSSYTADTTDVTFDAGLRYAF